MKLNATPDLLASLGGRLALRAQRSVLAHLDYRTLRRQERAWSAAGQGCQQATLWQSLTSRITVLRLSPGAALPWPDDAKAQEILVIEGQLSACPAAPTAGAGAAVVLAQQGYALRDGCNAGSLTAMTTGAQVYGRQLLVGPARLPAPEAQWWRLKRAPLQLVPAGTRRWLPNFSGVEVLPLWGNAEVTSMLVRFAAGAGVPDHAHAVDEDCLMLAGEMFLGDILLQPGDYPLALAGSRHFGESSDVGGSFFFHGAIDPVLVPLPV